MRAAVPSGISGEVLLRGIATAGCSAFSSRSDVAFAIAIATSHEAATIALAQFLLPKKAMKTLFSLPPLILSFFFGVTILKRSKAKPF